MVMIKKITITELYTLSLTHNYTFDTAPNSTNKNYYNVGDDIIDDIVYFNCGRIDWCLDVVINLFNSADEYVDSYLLHPNSDEITRLKEQCNYWMEVFG